MFLQNLGDFFKKAADGISHVAVAAFNGAILPLGHFLIGSVVPPIVAYIGTNPASLLSAAGLPTLGVFALSTLFSAAQASQNKDVALAAQAGKALYDAHVKAVAAATPTSIVAQLPQPDPVPAPKLSIVASAGPGAAK